MPGLLRCLAGAILFAVAFPLPVRAQDPDSMADRGWAVVVVWGGLRGIGTDGDVEDAMIRDGFDDDSECWLFCEGTVPHPTSHAGAGEVGLSSLFEFSYRRRDWPVGAAITLAHTHLGWTSGYRADGTNPGGDYLFLHYGVTTFGAAALLDLGPLEFQLGPALHRSDTWLDDAGADSQVQHAYGVGFLAGAGGSVRLYRGLHLEVRAQYRHVGGREVGRYQGDRWSLYEFEADFSHLFTGVGIGIRF